MSKRETKNVPEVSSWHTPASDYPRRKCGIAHIASFTYTPGFYESYGLNGHRFYHATRKLRITNLKIGGQVWMVDDLPHWMAMQEHARVMKGHVLCGGLGLGLMAHALSARPEVEWITIVEKEPDVIKLVKPFLPAKCQVVQGDFWEYKDSERVDGVLLDILVGKGADLLPAGVRQYLMLREMYGGEIPLRIHGFNNAYLESLSQDMRFFCAPSESQVEVARV